MGARVERTAEQTTVTGTGTLRGVDVDLRDMSDTAPTLAALAAFADWARRRSAGSGSSAAKESNRIAAIVTELRRLGVDAEETADGFVVRGAAEQVRGARVETYDDHRMAMAFALRRPARRRRRDRRPGVRRQDVPRVLGRAGVSARS